MGLFKELREFLKDFPGPMRILCLICVLVVGTGVGYYHLFHNNDEVRRSPEIVHKVEINQEIHLLGQQTPEPVTNTPTPVQTQPPVQTQTPELRLRTTSVKPRSQPNTQPPVRNSYRWISIKAITHSQMTIAGYQDNWKLHIARMKVFGSWVNGKSHGDDNDGKQICYVPYGGTERSTKTDFEILSSSDNTFYWYPPRIGYLPNRAVIGGLNPKTAETTYICRVFWKQHHFVVGKLLKSSRYCLIPHWGEKSSLYYEVLIDNKCSSAGPWVGSSGGTIRWVPFKDTSISRLTNMGDQGFAKIYIARSLHLGKWVSGKAHLHEKILTSYIPYKGKEYLNRDFQVLTWTPGKVLWVGTKRSNIPAGAIIGGHDPSSGEVQYVCRAVVDGWLLTGKAFRSSGICYIPYYGERAVFEYDVLVENTCGA